MTRVTIDLNEALALSDALERNGSADPFDLELNLVQTQAAVASIRQLVAACMKVQEDWGLDLEEIEYRDNEGLRARVAELEAAGNEVDRAQWKSSAERAHAMANLATVLERKRPTPSVREELPASDGRDQRESVEVTRSLDRGGNERRPSQQGVTAGETALHTCQSTPPGSACDGCRIEIAAERASVVTINMQSRPNKRRGGHVHGCPECHDNVPCDDACSTSEDLRLDDGTDRGAYITCERCNANLAKKASQLKEYQPTSDGKPEFCFDRMSEDPVFAYECNRPIDHEGEHRYADGDKCIARWPRQPSETALQPVYVRDGKLSGHHARVLSVNETGNVARLRFTIETDYPCAWCEPQPIKGSG